MSKVKIIKITVKNEQTNKRTFNYFFEWLMTYECKKNLRKRCFRRRYENKERILFCDKNHSTLLEGEI